jgi:penicillin-binding protein 2
MLVLTFVSVIRLLQVQIIERGQFAEQTRRTYTAEQIVPAVRGRIVDSQGRVLNTNQIVYKVILQRAFLPFGEENDVIAGIIEVLLKHEHDWIDSIPITMEQPYQFKNSPETSEEELDNFKIRLGLNFDATVDNCIKALAENYGIDTEIYDEQMIRFIGGVRYEMEFRQHFSFQNRYMFAEDVSMPVIIELKEKSLRLKGVDIVEEPIRLYLDGMVLPHIRGRINAISQEQYATLKNSGYSLNDVHGFTGLEKSMESTLRGENGTVETTRDSSWEVVSVETTKSARAGNSVKLTIDTQFQEKIERILADHINWINQRKNNPRRVGHTDTTAGAIVVLDVNTGAILAMASNPSFDLEDYVDLMLLEASGNMPFDVNPLIDRTIGHGYRPGSSFKTITGAAGLLQGVVRRDTSIRCGGLYTRFSDYRPRCHVFPRTHGGVNSTRALLTSCNIYYYEVGFLLGIDRFTEVTELFGVGENLNCDVSMFPGRMTTPEVYYNLLGHPMGQGDIVQAAIGQSETLMTPLHMAIAAMTIANGGVRLRPYLVDSVWNYDLSELIHKTQPEIVADMSDWDNAETHFKAVQDGMKLLGDRQRGAQFRYLPDVPAFKTGTPEVIPRALYNSTVLGYYPFDNPQIAFAIVLEGGEYSSRAIRNIIDAYFYDYYEPAFDQNGDTRYYWNRWTEPFPRAVPGRYGN